MCIEIMYSLYNSNLYQPLRADTEGSCGLREGEGRDLCSEDNTKSD